MGSHAVRLDPEAEASTFTELPRADRSPEHPLVFDSAAQELKVMADKGLVAIVDEHRTDLLAEILIDRLTFVNLL